MTTRLVRAPSAPSQASEFGACPSVCFHGWKWSLTKTESNPTSSARHEKSSNSRGPNCSADALYPSFSKGYSSLSSRALPQVNRCTPAFAGEAGGAALPSFLLLRSHPRQHVLAEAAHIGDHRIGG